MISINGVTCRNHGDGKKAIYCRWPSYKHLLINAFQSRVGKVINITVSGLSLRKILLFQSILPIPRFPIWLGESRSTVVKESYLRFGAIYVAM